MTAVAERRLTDPYPPEVAQAIVERLEAGEFLNDICAEQGMPDPSTFRRWKRADEELARQCARARVEAAVVDEQKVAELAAKVIAGEIEPEAARVAINAHTWLAKVRAPRVYGDKLEVEATHRVVPSLELTLSGPQPKIIEGEFTGEGK